MEDAVQNINEIKLLKREAKKLEYFFSKFAEETKNPQCDKHGKGFNIDGRFSVFKIGDVHFDAYTGYYGNSTCSSFFRIDDGLARKYFVKAFNNLGPQIFKEAARLMLSEAKSLQTQALKEIEELQNEVNSIEALESEE